MGGTTHGATGSRLYNIWGMMRARCSRPTCQDYPRYGGRGISICPAWDDFAVFQRWALSNGYRDDLTIDRRDTNGNYDPGNCRWATRLQQNRNRRDNIRYSWRGRFATLGEIAEEIEMPLSMLRQRVQRRGWAIEKATTAPRDNRGGIRENIVPRH